MACESPVTVGRRKGRCVLTRSIIRLAFVVACSFAAIAIAQEPFVVDGRFELAYLPYLTILAAGEPIGRLFATDIPAEFWSMGMPPRHAYALFTPAEHTEESECRGGVLSLDLEPGWNHVLMVRTEGGVELTSEPSPEGFGWHWMPQLPSSPGN